ncbi:uncharacterized protein LOC133289269 [Gastrolobium bilobum]|uniref:uncharacterized protein LOC133289269 n=1 Tax=Gastrolobium bilobum TaxID=150636 RepID=UPI002AB31C02|nr:uncharacterized protein LOC133289269 [Gastrolobium bilobum]
MEHQSIAQKVTFLESRATTQPPHTAKSSAGPVSTTIPSEIKAATIKLDVPRFDGSDPLGWVFKISQFFEFHGTPDPQRPRIASFYMEGEALAWYQWMFSNGQITSSQALLHALELRFAPSQYEDPKGDLMKLLQTASVREFQSQFETLANRCVDIRREVQALQPMSLAQAVGLARLQEDKLSDQRIASRSKFSPSSSWLQGGASRAPLVTASLSPGTSSASAPTTPTISRFGQSPKPRIQRLSPEELQVRRDKGLCYNCNEKYHPTHRCKRSLMLLIVAPESDEIVDMHHLLEEESGLQSPQEPLPEVSVGSDSAQISFHAFLGHSVPQTLWVQGRIGKVQLSILIDSGSTHNFVQPRIVKFLGLPLHKAPRLPSLSGKRADLVLGVQWLKTLGPILTDYDHLTMKFVKGGQIVTMQGNSAFSAQEASLAQLRRMVSTSSISELFQLQMVPSPPSTPFSAPIPQVIDALLSRFIMLFDSPSQLPPPRPTDHRIPLLEGSQAVNVRPYRYPYFQKKKIECVTSEMLAAGIVRDSTSPFSSPVLLVRKKDGSWHFCTDYRALNAITQRDRFPISTVDELIDELHGACCFSKLDLRSGYHQIRMDSSDIPKIAFQTHEGHFEYLVMPFGLCNAPATFQATMNSHSLEYLGHIISIDGVGPDPEKIRAMVAWPCPASIKQLRGSLGLTGFYRRFVHRYASIAAPLMDLLKKDAFVWSPAVQEAFDQLKLAMTNTPVLALPDFSVPFTLETDASVSSMGAVLLQHGHPIDYFSKTFCGKLQSSSTYVRELHAIVEAIKK